MHVQLLQAAVPWQESQLYLWYSLVLLPEDYVLCMSFVLLENPLPQNRQVLLTVKCIGQDCT